MTDPRTRFAGEAPPEAGAGQVRRFPLEVAGWSGGEPDDQVLVRHAGRNVVYPSPEALADAVRAADAAGVAAQRAQRRRALRAPLRTGFVIGLLLAPFVAALIWAALA